MLTTKICGLFLVYVGRQQSPHERPSLSPSGRMYSVYKLLSKLCLFASTEPVPVGDVERGSRSSLRGRYGEVMPVYRRDSHRDVQAGSHDYPGEGIYLLKFDNSYSLLRNKTLYFHIYYTS